MPGGSVLTVTGPPGFFNDGQLVYKPEETSMRTKFLLFFVSLVVMALAGCAKPEDKLLGTWKIISGGEDVYFTFKKNNELNVNNAVFTKYFVTKDNKLVLGPEDPVPFSVRKDVLRIKQEGLILTYTKVKTK
jgi:hypothetical protein